MDRAQEQMELNMSKTTVVKVTAKHIRAGIPEDACRCPVALAINEVSHQECCVAGNEFYFFGGNRQTLPWRAADFVKRFDNGPKCRLKPFSFRINL